MKERPYANLLFNFVALFQRVCGDHLTGVYLHGSLALGCFNPLKSDIDLLAVADAPLTYEQKRLLMDGVVRLNDDAPAKGLEMSVLLASDCKPFQYPTPFQLHFSPMHLAWYQRDPAGYIENMCGTDKDLAAHITVLHRCGITLAGRSIAEVFAAVPRADYIDSIWSDIENAQEDILRDPMYMTLNLCRVLACLQEGLCLSKQEGAFWGLAHLPRRFHPLLLSAASSYHSDSPMNSSSAEAQAFAAFMLNEIRRARIAP